MTSLNIGPYEICANFDSLKESIRHYLSRILADHCATEQRPLECDISLTFGSNGISDLEQTQVIALYEDSEGIIWVLEDINSDYIELDKVWIDNQIDIVKGLEQI